MPTDETREIDVAPSSGFYAATVKIQISRKKLSFIGKDGGRIEFQKLACKEYGDRLDIFASGRRTTTTVRTCDLGHRHEERKEGDYQAVYAQIDYEMVEQLIEWLQLGSWTEVRKQPC